MTRTIRPAVAGLFVALAISACSKAATPCWTPEAMYPETDRAVLQMTVSSDPAVRASGHAQKAERCIDRLANSYGQGRDSADVVAGAVVDECRGDLEMQASLEAGAGEDFEGHLAILLASAKRRATILVIRDRAAKCI